MIIRWIVLPHPNLENAHIGRQSNQILSSVSLMLFRPSRMT